MNVVFSQVSGGHFFVDVKVFNGIFSSQKIIKGISILVEFQMNKPFKYKWSLVNPPPLKILVHRINASWGLNNYRQVHDKLAWNQPIDHHIHSNQQR